MKYMISVREGNLDEVLKVHQNIIEFDEKYPSKDFFLDRYKSLEHVIIVAYCNDIPIGYIIGYKIDVNEFYCWLAGVDVNYRRNGALTLMVDYLKKWCIERRFKKISIKTRNKYRRMLTYLVNNNWNFESVEKKDNVLEYRINLTLDLE